MSHFNSLYPSMETLLISDVLTGKKTSSEAKKLYLNSEINNDDKFNNMINIIEQNNIIPNSIVSHHNVISSNPMCFSMLHTDGIRETILVRHDTTTKLGFGLVSIDGCVYISHIEKNSPASHAKIRFGDQIIRINKLEMAGLNGKQVIKYIKDAKLCTINILIRDRPLQKVYELYKDENNKLGLGFKNGIITNLETNSSASKNGIPIGHKIVEINTINVVGLSDMELVEIFKNANIQIYVGIMKLRDYKELVYSINKKKFNIMEHSPMIDKLSS